MSKVNGAMRVRHELEKLQATADKIQNNYNVVEAVNEEMEKVTLTFFFNLYTSLFLFIKSPLLAMISICKICGNFRCRRVVDLKVPL